MKTNVSDKGVASDSTSIELRLRRSIHRSEIYWACGYQLSVISRHCRLIAHT
jgi:hypothetical protein